MTREEAIKMLNRLLLSCDECPHHDCEECDIALNMAIQTLQQEQKRNNTSEKKKELILLADTLQGEINRMCVTNDLSELDIMALHAKKNIEKLQDMRYSDIDEKVREEQAKIEQLEHDILYEPTFSEEDGSM